MCRKSSFDQLRLWSWSLAPFWFVDAVGREAAYRHEDRQPPNPKSSGRHEECRTFAIEAKLLPHLSRRQLGSLEPNAE